jgi:peptide/nickel transport system substrate-binding protein
MRMLIALCLLFLTACTRVGSGVSTAGNPWTHPGRLVIASPGEPKSLNPVLAASGSTLDIGFFLFSWAVRYDERAQPHPDALREIPTVANGDVSRDGLTLRYKLRPNMKWHDGKPVTCADLRFTWQVVMNPHNNVVTTDGYKDIRSIDCGDPLVAVMRMRKVYAPFLQQLFAPNGNAAILPAHLLARYNDDKGTFNQLAYQSAPVGSGPFRFVRWERGQYVRLQAFDDFYLGRPKLREVFFKIVPDSNTLLTQMRTHEADLAYGIRAVHYEQYKKLPGVKVIAPPIYAYEHIDFNMRRPLFVDIRVRHALAYAIDRPAILHKIGHDLGDLAPADESPRIGHAYNPNVATYPYNPAKARALLEQAGWHSGTDGIRVKDGRRLSFTLSTSTESSGGAVTEGALQRYWRDVGAEALIKNYQSPLLFDNTANGILQGGKYDVVLFGWSAAADPDDSAIYSAENFAPRGQNALFWNDARATKAMNDALATVDWERRKKDYYIVQEELAEQLPTIVLSFAHAPIAYNSDLRGFAPSPVISFFWNPWEYAI